MDFTQLSLYCACLNIKLLHLYITHTYYCYKQGEGIDGGQVRNLYTSDPNFLYIRYANQNIFYKKISSNIMIFCYVAIIIIIQL